MGAALLVFMGKKLLTRLSSHSTPETGATQQSPVLPLTVQEPRRPHPPLLPSADPAWAPVLRLLKDLECHSRDAHG